MFSQMELRDDALAGFSETGIRLHCIFKSLKNKNLFCIGGCYHSYQKTHYRCYVLSSTFLSQKANINNS